MLLAFVRPRYKEDIQPGVSEGGERGGVSVAFTEVKDFGTCDKCHEGAHYVLAFEQKTLNIVWHVV